MNLKHTIEEQLILHEGLRTKVYTCPAGKLTIGVGRNLEDKGITKNEALFLLQNDIAECRNDLRNFWWFERLDPIRQKVLIDMRLNLGSAGFRKFKKMIACLEIGDYAGASEQMMDSRWYKQVGDRGKRLVRMMYTGEDYDK